MLAVLAVSLAALGVYLPTTRFALVWDDLDIALNSPAAPTRAFSSSFWTNPAVLSGRDVYYRPIVNLSLGLDRVVGQGRPGYFHLVNALLHAATAALLCLVLLQLSGSAWTALAGGLLYGLHPALADSVAYVSGRTDVLAGLGLVAALLGLLSWARRPGLRHAGLVLAGFAFAVFSKETAIPFLLLAAVWLAMARRLRLGRADVLVLAGLALVLAGYLLARRAVLGTFLGLTAPDRPLSALLLSANSFGRSVILFAVPFIRRVFAWDGPALARPTLFLAVTLGYCLIPVLLRRAERNRELTLAWLWGLSFLLPFAGLFGFGPLGRLLYVSGIGLTIMLVLAGSSLARRRPGLRTALTTAALLVSAAFVPATIARSRVWQDEYTLFRRMADEAPLNPTGHFNLGMELRRQGRTGEAEAAFQTVIALDTACYRAYSNLAALLQARGSLDSAAALYYRTIKLRPDYALAHNNLGIVLYLKGDHAPARALLRRAIQLEPGDAGAAFNLSRIYFRLGQRDSARFFLEHAFRLQPENPQIRAAYEQMPER